MDIPRTAYEAGLKFNRLTAVRHIVKGYWLWKCDCGAEKRIKASDVSQQRVKSCGCWSRERTRTHGKSRTRIYKAWRAILDRCNNPECRAYHNYGGRGIQVKFASFEEFYAEIGDPPPGLSVDRINNDGHYEAGNLRWATDIEQHNNTRRTHFLTHAGRTRSVTQWAEDLGLNRETLYARIRKGYPVEKVLSVADYSNRSHLSIGA